MSGIAEESIQRDGNGNATSAFRSTSTPPISSTSVPPPHMSIPTYASLHMDTDESTTHQSRTQTPHQSRAQTPIIAADQQQFNTVAAQRVIDAEQQIERLQQELLHVRQTLNQQPRHAQPQAQHAMAQPAIRMRELKLPEPKEFRGTRDRVSIREWIRDIEEIFTMGSMPMDHQTTIIYAAHYLRDDAKTWYKMHEASITSWNAFKHLMIERYKDPREVDKARTRLLTTKQVGSVDSYTTTFDRATLELTEVAGQAPRDEELLFYYREGLKSPIKTFLAARGAIANLRELQEVAMEIDAAMNSNRININTSNSTSYKPQPHKSSHSGHSNNNYPNNNNRYRPSSYQGGSNNRFPQSNRFNQYRSAPQFSRPSSTSTYNPQNSNRTYTPMDTSNVITQQRRPLPNRIDNRSSDRKPTFGNCFKCGKTGHFSRDCPTNKPQPKQHNNVIMEESSSSTLPDDSVLIINEINNTAASKQSKPLITFMGLVNGQPAYILVDSGATNNYISEAFVKKYKLYTEPLDKSAEAILANGISLNVTRMVPSIQIHIQDYKDELNANVLALDKYDIILSMAWLHEFNPTINYRNKSITFEHNNTPITLQPMPVDKDIHTPVVISNKITPIPTAEEITSISYDRKLTLQVHTIHDSKQLSPTPMQQALKQIPANVDKQAVNKLVMLLQKHIDVFPTELPSGIPEHVVMHEIEFKPDAKPIKQHPYPLAPKYLPFFKETIDMLLAKGFIIRSTSPSQVPITIAAKDGGTDFRFCVDYRAVRLFARMFMKEIVRLHGIPKRIIS